MSISQSWWENSPQFFPDSLSFAVVWLFRCALQWFWCPGFTGFLLHTNLKGRYKLPRSSPTKTNTWCCREPIVFCGIFGTVHSCRWQIKFTHEAQAPSEFISAQKSIDWRCKHPRVTPSHHLSWIMRQTISRAVVFLMNWGHLCVLCLWHAHLQWGSTGRTPFPGSNHRVQILCPK